MGVQGLWQLLDPLGRPVTLERLENKVLAIDASIWLHQAVRGFRDEHGNPLPNAHLMGFFHRICKLLFYCIKPVFVFDGAVPQLKRKTMAARRERQQKAEKDVESTRQQILNKHLQSLAIRQTLAGTSSGLRSTANGPSASLPSGDLFELPPLPPTLDPIEEVSSDEDDADAENSDEWMTYRSSIFQNLDSLDLDSPDFKALPLEIQHEFLLEIKERSKRRSFISEDAMPEDPEAIGNFQIQQLLRRRRIQRRLDDVGKDMNAARTGDILDSLDVDMRRSLLEHDGEVRRINSEDSAHYFLFKRIHRSMERNKAAAALAADDKESSSDKREPVAGASGSNLPDTEFPEYNPEDYLSPAGSGNELAAAENNSELVSDIDAFKALSDSTVAHEANSQMVSDTQLKSVPETDSRNKSVLVFSQTSLASNYEHESESPSRLESTTTTHQLDSIPQNDFKKEGSESISGSELDLIGPVDPASKINSDVLPSSELPKNELNAKRSDQLKMMESSAGNWVAGEPEVSVFSEPLPSASANTSTDIANDTKIGVVKLLNAEGLSFEATTSRLKNVFEKFDETLQKSETVAASDSKTTIIVSLRNEAPPTGMPSTSVNIEDDSDDDDDDFVEVETKSAESDSLDCEPGPALVDIFDDLKEGSNRDETKADASRSPQTADDGDKRMPATEPLPRFLATVAALYDSEELRLVGEDLERQTAGLQRQKASHERVAVTIADQAYVECQELLRLFGVPFVVSPAEAEAQCAVLDRAGLTEGTVTEDSDIWLFGATRVYKNFFEKDRDVAFFTETDIARSLRLDRSKLIALALLTGSDYTEGVRGVGVVSAVEVLAEFPHEDGVESLRKLYEWWCTPKERRPTTETRVKQNLRKVELTPGFPNEAVVRAYLQPTVDESEEQFSWATPDLDALRTFGRVKLGWTQEKVDGILLPVIKKLGVVKDRQTRMDSFFHPVPSNNHGLGTAGGSGRRKHSQRLKRALNKVQPTRSDNNDRSAVTVAGSDTLPTRGGRPPRGAAGGRRGKSVAGRGKKAVRGGRCVVAATRAKSDESSSDGELKLSEASDSSASEPEDVEYVPTKRRRKL